MLESEIVRGVTLSGQSPAQVGREFRALIESGVPLRPAGEARDDPESLLGLGYTPKYKIELFDVTFYLCNLRDDEDLRFLVAYVLVREGRAKRPALYPRIFYKDISLVWRTATHFIREDDDNWIGKGDVKWLAEGDHERLYSAEETANLPLEIQAAIDVASRPRGRVPRDYRAVERVLRRAPQGRIRPFADFSAPRRRAQQREGALANGGEPVAWFERAGDPGSLRFAPGFEPDFRSGVLEVYRVGSRLYGGEVAKHRILSTNKQIQYQFDAAPRHVWIIPPQLLTREISSYGVRTLDVVVDEDLCVPGFEYHFIDEDEEPPALHTQIPEGYAGPASEVDPSRADASAWLDALSVIREFREVVLRGA